MLWTQSLTPWARTEEGQWGQEASWTPGLLKNHLGCQLGRSPLYFVRMWLDLNRGLCRLSGERGRKPGDESQGHDTDAGGMGHTDPTPLLSPCRPSPLAGSRGDWSLQGDGAEQTFWVESAVLRTVVTALQAGRPPPTASPAEPPTWGSL